MCFHDNQSILLPFCQHVKRMDQLCFICCIPTFSHAGKMGLACCVILISLVYNMDHIWILWILFGVSQYPRKIYVLILLWNSVNSKQYTDIGYSMDKQSFRIISSAQYPNTFQNLGYILAYPKWSIIHPILGYMLDICLMCFWSKTYPDIVYHLFHTANSKDIHKLTKPWILR
jgi:nitrogen fixation-related uncharacterized protein